MPYVDINTVRVCVCFTKFCIPKAYVAALRMAKTQSEAEKHYES